MKKVIYVFIILFPFFNNAQQLTLEGNYSYRNIYIQNPLSGSGFCTDKVLVNGEEVAFRHESVFEIKLDSLGFKGGNAVKIELFHKSDCKPKALMDHITPRHDFPVSISVDSTGVLRWETKEETANADPSDSILKMEMSLSAFGVEADDFPSINVLIDFSKDSAICTKTFYNPSYKSSTYSLHKNELKAILQLLKTADLAKLKKEYTINVSDQPRSKIVIYTTKTQFAFDDYGLVGEYPLKELYRIVYKL